MNYKKINNEHYNLHLIKNNRFKTINVDVYFSSLFNKNDIPYINLLIKILTYSTKKYNTKSELAIKSENLYNAVISSKYITIGNLEGILIGLEFINPVYTEENMYQKTFEFLNEIIFNPNIKINSFDEEIFTLIKNNIIREIKSLRDKPDIISYENYASIMYKGTSGEYSLLGNIEDYENITNNDLFLFYNKLFKEFKVDIVVLGDYPDDKMISMVDKIFKKINPKYEKIKTLFIKSKIKNKYLINKEEFKFNQSILHMGYKFDDLSEYEINYVLSIYNVILGTMNNSVLFTKIREENSYCYNISSFISKYNTSLTITSGINRKNFDKVIEKIKECIQMMNDEKVINKLLKTAIKTANTYLNDYYDNIYSIMEFYYLNEFERQDEIEKRREIYNKITSKDIVDLNKKIHLDTIYFMEGVNDETDTI